MALTRRSSQRVSNSIWPGFVDAMTALLLVMMFVLTIFMVVQFVLREEISGQANALDTLGAEVAGLTRLLGLEQERAAALEADNASQETALDAAERRATQQAALISSLTAETEAQGARIADFEAQVASLLTQRDTALATGEALSATVAELEAAQRQLLSEQDQLQLALARTRDEVDAQAEQARLAAARREALEALTTDLRNRVSDQDGALSAADAALVAAQEQLSA